MEKINIEEELKRHPYLEKYLEHTIFTSDDDMRFLFSTEKLTVKYNTISSELLIRILTEDDYFEYAYKFLSGQTNEFTVASIKDGFINYSISYNKYEIIKGIATMIKDGLLLSKKEQERFEALREFIYFRSFLKKYKFFKTNLDGKEYLVPFDQMLYITELSDEEFKKLCQENKSISDIPLPYIICTIIDIIEQCDKERGIIVPEETLERFNRNYLTKIIDIEAINQHLDTPDTVYKNVKVNEELKSEILNGMPEDATQLEKALYIYIKLCKKLTYNSEYYALDQHGDALEKHKDIGYISTITPAFNEAVCFEFNAIYSKFLNELGINFKSTYRGTNKEDYGNAHADLEFRCNKFLINADAVKSIFRGDLLRAKTNQNLDGISCLNQNHQTQQEFQVALSNMYKLIQKQEQEKIAIPINHEELIEEYKKVTTNMKKISLMEKLNLIIEKIQESNLTGIDSLSYLLQLKKIIFSEDEKENNIHILIVRNNESANEFQTANAIAIISLNSHKLSDDEQNRYFYFDGSNHFAPITKESLQEKFDNHVLEYIDILEGGIPGIAYKGRQ